MKTRALRIFLVGPLGTGLAAAVVLMATRVGDQARFVSWPVVGFTALGAAVAVVGVWTGARKPSLFAAGLVPALVMSYFLPAAPFTLVAMVLVAIGAAAIISAGLASGMALRRDADGRLRRAARPGGRVRRVVRVVEQRTMVDTGT